MKRLIGCAVIVLIILHQDYWQWDDTTLLCGLLPYTLVYHAGISVAAAVVWWLAVLFCWPQPDSETEHQAVEP